MLGGFTTYSALAADAASLLGDGATGAGILYALATVLVDVQAAGVAEAASGAAPAGIALAVALRRKDAR